MNQSIWKYTLAIQDTTILYIPKGSIILSAALQTSDLCIWALVNTDEAAQEEVIIDVYGTGNPIASSLMQRQFIGTVVAGRYVWHVFRRERQSLNP